MARITYDDQTAAAYKAVREVPRDGLGAWREAVRRNLRPSPSLAEFLEQADNFRHADTNMRGLTEEEFLRGKEQLRRAVKTARTETRTNWLDLLVLR
jgi:hypothetical protein